MARRPTPDTGIGARVKERRELLGLSIRRAAQMAGVHHSTWSRIESGVMGADNRFTLATIATALRCSVSTLIGVGEYVASDPRAAQGHALAYDTVRALVDADLQYPATAGPTRPLPQLAADVRLIRDLRTRCDYLGAGRILPPAVRDLHAHATTTSGPEREQALRLLIDAGESASFVARYMGERPGSALVAERVGQAATLLGDPLMSGLADWTRAHAAIACGLYGRAYVIAERGTDQLIPRATTTDALEMLGMLHLTAAFAAYGDGDPGKAGGLLAEADNIAERTGDGNTLGLFFGPTNIRFWRVSMDADGDAGAAVAVARDTNPATVESVSRQTAFFIDTGRALTRLGARRDAEAIRMIAAAERQAPQRVRSDRLVAETLRTLLERSRRQAAGVELRGLCERAGVGA